MGQIGHGWRETEKASNEKTKRTKLKLDEKSV